MPTALSATQALPYPTTPAITGMKNPTQLTLAHKPGVHHITQKYIVSRMLTWSTCIATLNRHDALMVALTHVSRQTRRPSEVIVVDTSDNWEEGKLRAQELLKDCPEISLDYLTSAVRSSATQRNLAISRASSDIVMMIDDDSFLHDDCAEKIMEVFEADTEALVAGVGARIVDENPAQHEPSADAPQLQQKNTGRRSTNHLRSFAMSTRLGRWFNREILFQNAQSLFLCYDEPRERKVPECVAHLKVRDTVFMPGSGMAYRRVLSEKEKFDTALRYYAAFEDLDLAYRLARHGALLRAGSARYHHFEAASGRIKREKIVTFQLLNMAVFLKRHAKDPDVFLGKYRIMLLRRLLSEFLKDGLSQRWRFPQVAGALNAMKHWREIWSRDAAEIDSWYPEFQKRILENIK